MGEAIGATTRRIFLGATAAVGSVLAGKPSAAPREAAAVPEEKSPDGYRESEHVRTAYRRMRF